MLSLAGLTGCATIFNGSEDKIHIRSEEPGTKFYLNDQELGIKESQKGTYAVTTIPKKDLKKAVLKAEKPTCTPVLSHIETKFDATTMFGFLLDYGLISILVVDWAMTGAVRTAARTDIVMTPNCASQATSTPIWIYNRVLEETKKKEEEVKKQTSPPSGGSTGWGGK